MEDSLREERQSHLQTNKGRGISASGHRFVLLYSHELR